MNKINALALFDGMSCGRIALEKLGIKSNYFASEIDKAAIAVAAHNYPDTVHLGDVRHIDAAALPRMDIVMGGSPCYDVSMCGYKRGISTEAGEPITTFEQYMEYKQAGATFTGQSYLFWEFVRLYRETNAKYFLLENVKMAKHWEDMISEVLGCRPIAINSSLVSAQNRPRLYWTNIPGASVPEERNVMLADIMEDGPRGFVGELKPSVRKNLVEQLDEVLASDGVIHALKCDSGWQDNRVGIAKSPCLRASSVCAIGRTRSGAVRLLTAEEFEILQTVPVGYTAVASDRQRKKMLGNGWTVDVIAHLMKGLLDV